MIDKLKQFGKVEVCKELDQTFHIKITDGFNPRMGNVKKIIDLISEHLAGKYTKSLKCTAKENDFEYILKNEQRRK